MARTFSHLNRATLVLLALGLSGGAIAQPGFDDGRWQINVMPYLWFPGAEATIDRPAGVDVSASIDSDDLLSNLNTGLMLTGQARKDKWLLFTDLIYVDLGRQETRVTNAAASAILSGQFYSQATTDMSVTIWGLGGGYNLVQDPAWSLDLVGGLRYIDVDSDLNLRVFSSRGQSLGFRQVSLDNSGWDAIIGANANFSLQGTPWFVPLYGDIGTGSSDLTWQLVGGVGYRFDWGQATLAWRAIGYDFGDNLDLTLSGPAIGVGFQW